MRIQIQFLALSRWKTKTQENILLPSWTSSSNIEMVGPQPNDRPNCVGCETPDIRLNNGASRSCCRECKCEENAGCEKSDQRQTYDAWSSPEPLKRNSLQRRHRKRIEPDNAKASNDRDVDENSVCAEGSVGRVGLTTFARKPINCNLDRFLESTCPSVQPLYLPKSCRWEACQIRLQKGDAEPLPYFSLGDLWESFDEWSAYGAGVPIILSGKETVVQYYVPYLSAMQLYTHSGKSSFVKFRRPGEDSDVSDGEWRDSCSEASSDGESGKVPNCWNCECGKSVRRDAVTCCVCDSFEKEIKMPKYRVGDSVEECGWDWRGHLLFEYFENSPPHARVPLVDKIADLTRGFPQLRTLRSVDLLPASWMSVAWYPIYRIPTGPTLRDLAACFLTYHCLSTSWQDGAPSGIVEPTKSPAACSLSFTFNTDIPRINLQAFGLAHYKLRGSIWASAGNQERRHASSLFRCAESWLRCLGVHHPDFMFFISHNPTSR